MKLLFLIFSISVVTSFSQMSTCSSIYSEIFESEINCEETNNLISEINSILEDSNLKTIEKVYQIDTAVFFIMHQIRITYQLKAMNFLLDDENLSIDTVAVIAENICRQNHFTDKKGNYNATDAIDSDLPSRQLVFAIQKRNKWLIYYNHGGGFLCGKHLVYIDIDNPTKTIVFTSVSEPNRMKLIGNIQIEDIRYYDKEIFNSGWIDIF